MSERPILFSGPMVRAILEGRKSQTRRVVKPMRDPNFGSELSAGEIAGEFNHGSPEFCPYGLVGDRLWVRETFSGARAYETNGYPLKQWGNKIWYWADGNPRSGDWTRPRPSIHMPRHLSRITLDVTGVRVERLQSISYADILAEGVRIGAQDPEKAESLPQAEKERLARDAWWALWTLLHGESSWDANPFLWVIEFKRLTP